MLIKPAFFKSLLGVAVLKVIWYYILFFPYVSHIHVRKTQVLEKNEDTNEYLVHEYMHQNTIPV